MSRSAAAGVGGVIAVATAADARHLHHLLVPPQWRCIDFTSDVHLHDKQPRTAEVFFEALMHSPADAIVLLGDLFDVWVGDDVLDQSGFERDCVERLREVATTHALYFMSGNRDFLVGPRFLGECQAHRLSDPTHLHAWGIDVVVTHGDAWCLADNDYLRFRAQVRDPAWQAAVLAEPLAKRRELALQIRHASEQRKTAQGAESYGDVDESHAEAWLKVARATVLIHGHTHRPSSGPYAGQATRHVLSDWEADSTPPRGDLLRWTAAGFERRSAFEPAPASPSGTPRTSP